MMFCFRFLLLYKDESCVPLSIISFGLLHSLNTLSCPSSQLPVVFLCRCQYVSLFSAVNKNELFTFPKNNHKRIIDPVTVMLWSIHSIDSSMQQYSAGRCWRTMVFGPQEDFHKLVKQRSGMWGKGPSKTQMRLFSLKAREAVLFKLENNVILHHWSPTFTVF